MALTLGVYYLVWMYQTTNQLNQLTKSKPMAPGLVVLWMILTVGLYQFYWWYKVSQKLNEVQSEIHIGLIVNNSFLLIVLALFCLPVVSVMIFQSDLNALSENLEQQSLFHRKNKDDEWTDY